MPRSHRVGLLLTASPLVLALATAAHAEVAARWSPHVAIQGLVGGQSAGAFSAWLPLIQSSTSLVHADPYYVMGDGYSALGFGLGYRAILSPAWVLGAYGFIDGSAVVGEDYLWQGTVGVEALSPDFEARANFYAPLGGVGTAHSGDSLGAILESDNTLDLLIGKRIGVNGADAEAGYRVLKWGGDSGDGLRAFAGAYSWWRDGISAVTGFQGRLEARFTKPGSGLRFTMSAGVSSDGERGTQWAAMAGLSVPLGATGGQGGGGSDSTSAIPMDEDVVHHWGALSTVTQELERAYFLNGRETGTVEFADGAANNANDGRSIPDATSLAHAVTLAGVNGIVVAVDTHGDIETTGQTLLNGQALVGGGGSLPLAAADGTTGFYWNAPGSRGTIEYTGTTGFALTLADYNSVIFNEIETAPALSDISGEEFGAIKGVDSREAWISDNDLTVDVQGVGSSGSTVDDSGVPGGAATGVDGYAGVSASAIVGIDLNGSSDATVIGNDVNVKLRATGGNGGGATGGDATAGAGGNATGGKSGTAVSGSAIVGLALDDSSGADVHGNTITVTVTAQSGRAGTANAGDGGTASGAAGIATGGAGGIGLSGSAVYGVSLENAEAAQINNNSVIVSLTAIGGVGGDATTGGKGGGGTIAAAGGAATGGAGGVAISNSNVGGIYADGATQGVTINDNDVNLTLTDTTQGGAGGKGTGGTGGAGDTGGNGGMGVGGAGGDTTTGSEVFGIAAETAPLATITNNDVELDLTGQGGVGGMGVGGSAGGEGATGGTGGEADGGNGGAGFDGLRATGIITAVTPTLSGNEVRLTVKGTGGVGGTGSGGGANGATTNGAGGVATGGDGGAGLLGDTFIGELFGHGLAQVTDEAITVTLTGHGGFGGNVLGGPGGDTGTTGGAGGKATGGNGGDGLAATDATGMDFGGSDGGAIVAGGSILIVANGLSGGGGGADGGNGGSASTTGGAGGEGIGGNAGAGVDTGGFLGFDARASNGIADTGTTITVTVTAASQSGGTGDGGTGGSVTSGTGAVGGVGSGGGAVDTTATLVGVDLLGADDADFEDGTVNVTFNASAGFGNDGVGGIGGASGAKGGQGNGGRGGDIATTMIDYGVTVRNSTNVTLTGNQVVVNFTGTGGDAGNGTGGRGGAGGGLGGNASAFTSSGGSGNTAGTGFNLIDETGAVGLDATDNDFSGSPTGTDGAGGTSTPGDLGPP